MKRIKLSQGKYALVDDIDYKWLNQWKWSYDHGYARRKEWIKKEKKEKSIYMHQLIVGFLKNIKIDHKDGNKLNNQRFNLRKSAHNENIRNQKIHKNNTSGYKGVYLNKRNRKWEVEIHVNYKKIYLGSFSNKIDAAKAYNQAAVKHHQEFAKLNII